MNIAQGYKKQGEASWGVWYGFSNVQQFLKKSKKLKFVTIVPLICYSIFKILVDCDDKSLRTFPVVVLTTTFLRE